GHMGGLVKPPLTLIHRAGIPVVYVLHDRWVMYERVGGPTLLPWAKLDRLFATRARQAATRVAPRGLELRAPPIAENGVVRYASRWVRDEHASAGWVARDEGTLPTGVDVEGIRSRRTRPPRTPPERLPFARRIDASKGLHVAVRALAEAPEGMTLSVAGPLDDAEYYEEVRRLARQLGVFERIHWLGELPDREQVLDLLGS